MLQIIVSIAFFSRIAFGVPLNTSERDGLKAVRDTFAAYNPNWIQTSGWVGDPVCNCPTSGTQCPSNWTGVVCTDSHITNFDVVGKGLEGPIPAELGVLRYVFGMSLGGNKFNGTLPNLLFANSFFQMQTFDVSNNKLTGTIPAALFNSTKIIYLYMYNNNFTGTLPPEFIKLTAVRNVAVHANSLNGVVPPLIAPIDVACSFTPQFGNGFCCPFPSTILSKSKCAAMKTSGCSNSSTCNETTIISQPLPPTPETTPQPTPKPTPQPTPQPTPKPPSVTPLPPTPETTSDTPSTSSNPTPTTSLLSTDDPSGRTPPPPVSAQNSTNQRNTAAIAGGIVGGLLVISATVIVFFFVIKRNRRGTTHRVDSHFVHSGSNAGSESRPTFASSNGVWLQHVTVGRRLGGGQFGDVFEGTWETTKVALKRLVEGTNTLEFEREASLLGSLRHPNVVNFLGLYTDTVNRQQYIVTEFMAGGGLDSVLHSKGRSMTTLDKLAISQQIANGCVYLAGRGIVHRDLASRNILFDGGSVAKVGDLGMSRVVGDPGATASAKAKNKTDVYQPVGNTMLPVRWCSPESLQSLVFSSASDVWSFGVVIWEIFSNGDVPYGSGRNIEGVCTAIIQGEKLGQPRGCPERTYRLMLWCWNNNPAQRPTFHQIHAELQACIDEEQASSHDTHRASVFFNASMGRTLTYS